MFNYYLMCYSPQLKGCGANVCEFTYLEQVWNKAKLKGVGVKKTKIHKMKDKIEVGEA